MRIWIAVLIVMASVGVVGAKNDCKSSIDLSKSKVDVEVPDGATSFAVLNAAKAPPILATGVTAPVIKNGKLELSGDYLGAIKAASPITPFELVWSNTGGEVCRQPLGTNASTSPAAAAAIAAGASRTELQNCNQAAQRWFATIRGQRRKSGSRDDFTAVVFTRDGAVCARNRDYGVTGDPIYVGYWAMDNRFVPTSVAFDPCELEKEEPSVYVPTNLENFKVHGAPTAQELPPVSPVYEGRTCFNRTVTVEVTASDAGDAGKAVTWRTAIAQHTRYRATAQIGIISTDLHESDFTLITDSSGTQRIFNKGPVDDGPEWYANVVIYGIGHYLRDLGGKTRYQGRDIIHDQSFNDRLGVYFGAALDEPTKRLSAGFSFELLAGVNLLGGYERARVNELVGFSDGDPFTGATADLPIRDRWQGDWRWGVALDLRYLIAIFQRK